MAKTDYRKGAVPFAFVALPKDVLRSTEFGSMQPSAKALMLDLAAQYTGKNNGRLCPGFEVMKRSGWTSKHTVLRAKEALLDSTFAICTRKGHPPRTTDWIGFTWWKLDWDQSMDVSALGWPYLNFVTALSVVPKQHHKPSKQAPGGAKTAPIDPQIEGPSVQKRHHATEVTAENARGAKTAPVIEVAISASSSAASSAVGLKAVPDRRPPSEKSALADLANTDRNANASEAHGPRLGTLLEQLQNRTRKAAAT